MLKMKTTILLIFVTIMTSKKCSKFTQSLYYKDIGGPFTNTGLTCGKEDPKEQSDCTKYGTDSGMYCCWVAKDENDDDGKCHLISGAKIERIKIDGCAQFTDSYWSCGNSSCYIKINIVFIGLLILMFSFSV